jgi:hypothetical protein
MADGRDRVNWRMSSTALHDRLRQLSRCAFAHQRRVMNHAQFARRRLGEKASLRRRTFVVDAHAHSESEATTYRSSVLRSSLKAGAADSART